MVILFIRRYTTTTALMDEKGDKSVVVFDFDYTLSEAHMYHLIGGGHIIKWHMPLERQQILDNKSYVTAVIFGGQERVDRMRTFLQGLVQDGRVLAISSNNYLEHIKRALTHVDLLDYFTWIHARNSFYRGSVENLKTGQYYNEAGRKQDFITTFLLPIFKCIVFIDDEMLDAYYFAFSNNKNVHLLAMRRNQRGIDDNDFIRIKAALTECESKSNMTAQLTNLVCVECKEREAAFYSPIKNLSFCDPFCERRYDEHK